VTVRLVWAQSHGGVIGLEGGLPWRLPEDLRRFKELTMGSAVVMGRVTWDSLPATVRPLPGRRNLVLTRREGFVADGAATVASVADALALVDGDLWVIGGASVYAAFLSHADGAVVTEIDAEFAGDTYATPLPPEWRTTASEPSSGWHHSESGLRYRVLTYERVGATQEMPITGSV
jgi:dihydrofolate reductase